MIDYTLFESTPGIGLAFFADAPKFTIAASTHDFIRISGIRKEEAIGKGISELVDSSFTLDILEQVRSSLSYVHLHRSPHEIFIRDFKIADKKNSKDWRIKHVPVLNSKSEFTHIIQQWKTEDKNEFTGKSEIGSKDIEQFHRLFMTAPVVIGVVRGDEYIIELANDDLLEIWNRTSEVIGKPLLEAIPELKGQGFIELLNEVRRTGKSYQAKEAPIKLVRHGEEEMVYMNFVYEAFYDDPPGKTASGVIAIGYDVTEHVLARRKEEESRQELELAVEIAQLGTYSIDLSISKHLITEKFIHWFGLDIQTYQRECSLVLIHPDDRQQVQKAVLATLQHGAESRHNVTYRIVRPEDGSIRHLRSFGKTLFNTEEKPYLIIGIVQDITDQVLHQKQLEENEVLLQQKVKERTEDLNNQKAFISSILDASLDGIYALKALRDKEGRITDFQYLFANKYIAGVLNVDAEQLIGSYMLELLPENKNNGFFDLFCKLLSKGETFRDETHFVTKGIDSWFDFAVVPINSETLVVSILDISDKKRSIKQIEEQRNLLNSILQNSSNGISVSQVIRDSEGAVIDAQTILANDAAVKYTGLAKEIYLSKRATELDPNLINSPYYHACINTLVTGEPFVMQYYLETTKRWLELTVSKLDNNRLIHIFTDVTPVKETQLQLEKSVEELQRSNQNLKQFAYAASHDLKEPMRKIQLFSDRIKEHLEGKLDKEHQHYFNRILQATNRMNTLIDDLLIYSSVSSGVILDEEVNLNEVVKTVLEDLEIPIEENKTNITVGVLPTIKGNRRQLQQLFQNLIGNAIKYKKAGVNSIVSISSRLVNRETEETFSFRTGLDHQSYHLIEVNDNGIGFDPKDAERIFDVFVRLHGSNEYKGTGVGLSIVRKVAENHGGFIMAESKPGEGSTFKLWLPVS